MFASVHSAALVGVEPRPVRVEVHVGSKTPSFSLVGLPDASVREAKERVRSALICSGYPFPNRRVTVNLAPADLPKVGSAYDLPIALGVLAAAGEIPAGAAQVVALGELALDGSVRPARGGLAAGLVARRMDVPCVLPPASAAEAALVEGASIRAARSLAQAVAAAFGEVDQIDPIEPAEAVTDAPDLSQVRGQAAARRALEIAAAGGHHLLMVGPPGAGKTLLARCLPGILPELERDEALEVAQAWAAAGTPRLELRRPPFRHPHHTASVVAIVGGGSGVPVPGELTLAHRGVLFLDELGEFPPGILDALRQPLEDGSVTVARKGISVQFPCRVQVVAATNPCPCGFRGDRRTACRCGSGALERYRRRLSGPLADRIDLRVGVGRVSADELTGPPGERSAEVRRRVEGARDRQVVGGVLNRELGREELDAVAWSTEAGRLLTGAMERMDLTARGFDRVRRVARTIADLAGSDEVGEGHVGEALAYRGIG